MATTATQQTADAASLFCLCCCASVCHSGKYPSVALSDKECTETSTLRSDATVGNDSNWTHCLLQIALNSQRLWNRYEILQLAFSSEKICKLATPSVAEICRKPCDLCSKIHAQYDWTTRVPDNGNEWRKFRAVPRLYPLHSLVCTLFNKGGSRRAFRLPGAGGDHFHCAVEPSPGHIRCQQDCRLIHQQCGEFSQNPVAAVFSCSSEGVSWSTCFVYSTCVR